MNFESTFLLFCYCDVLKYMISFMNVRETFTPISLLVYTALKTDAASCFLTDEVLLIVSERTFSGRPGSSWCTVWYRAVSFTRRCRRCSSRSPFGDSAGRSSLTFLTMTSLPITTLSEQKLNKTGKTISKMTLNTCLILQLVSNHHQLLPPNIQRLVIPLNY